MNKISTEMQANDQPMFKMLFADARLVKMILENHGFCHTETNDWNILWTCTGTQ